MHGQRSVNSFSCSFIPLIHLLLLSRACAVHRWKTAAFVAKSHNSRRVKDCECPCWAPSFLLPFPYTAISMFRIEFSFSLQHVTFPKLSNLSALKVKFRGVLRGGHVSEQGGWGRWKILFNGNHCRSPGKIDSIHENIELTVDHHKSSGSMYSAAFVTFYSLPASSASASAFAPASASASSNLNNIRTISWFHSISTSV